MALQTMIDWAVSDRLIDYAEAVALMEMRVADIADGHAPELVWLLEHPPLYTAGTSARPDELLWPNRFPVHLTGRGGRYTYHGPGQRIAYVMLDVRRRGGDLRAFVAALEAWVIDTLDTFGVTGITQPCRIGVWVSRPGKGCDSEEKIAAIGLRIRRGVSYHGLSLNVAPDLEHFAGIVPCGIADRGVTSLAALGRNVSRQHVDVALRTSFERRFAVTRTVAPPSAPALPRDHPLPQA